MKSRNVWLYVLLGIALTLIGLGLVYTENKKDSTDKDGNSVAEPIRKQFELIDTDNNGSISLREFAEQMNARGRAAQAQTQKARLKKLQAQFEAGDKNTDSFIDAEEYAELTLIKRQADKAPALASYDSNGDGKLGFREYVAFRSQLTNSK
ncbi:MAG: EF-hand domain-containing protein [Porticoccaceae bacterium]